MNAYTPGIITEAGIHTFLPVEEAVCSHGQYPAAYELFTVEAAATTFDTVAPYCSKSTTEIQSPLVSAKDMIESN